MKAQFASGVVYIALCCSSLHAQQADTASLVASAARSEAEGALSGATITGAPSVAISSTSTRAIPAPVAGDAWLASSGWSSSRASNLAGEDCAQLKAAQVKAVTYTESPGGGLTLHDFSMHGEFTRDHMVKMARNFVPGQPLPDAPSYTPLTSREKFDVWLKHTYSVDIIEGAAFDSLILQATGGYRDYGGGMGGYSKRYGTTLMAAEAGSMFGRWLFPSVLHQDPRYFPSHETNVFDRMAYAASRAVITRSDDGRNVFNSSLVLTLLFTSALANGYKPNYDESFQATLANSAGGIGTAAQMNLLNEFWPDIKAFFAHHEPNTTKQVRKKVSDLTLHGKNNQQ